VFASPPCATEVPRNATSFFRHYCRFFREMTYDTVSFEMTIVDRLPDHGAISAGGPGRSRIGPTSIVTHGAIARAVLEGGEPQFEALAREVPPGMKALGGVGNGVLEHQRGPGRLRAAGIPPG